MSYESFLKTKTCALKVNIDCEGCKKKVKKILQKIDGVYIIQVERESGRVIVSGNVEPEILINELKKHKKFAGVILADPRGNHGKQLKERVNNGNAQGQMGGNGTGGATDAKIPNMVPGNPVQQLMRGANGGGNRGFPVNGGGNGGCPVNGGSNGGLLGAGGNPNIGGGGNGGYSVGGGNMNMGGGIVNTPAPVNAGENDKGGNRNHGGGSAPNGITNNGAPPQVVVNSGVPNVGAAGVVQNKTDNNGHGGAANMMAVNAAAAGAKNLGPVGGVPVGPLGPQMGQIPTAQGPLGSEMGQIPTAKGPPTASPFSQPGYGTEAPPTGYHFNQQQMAAMMVNQQHAAAAAAAANANDKFHPMYGMPSSFSPPPLAPTNPYDYYSFSDENAGSCTVM